MTESKALEIATAAMADATKAQERIAGHEKLCAFRWAVLIALLGAQFAAVLSITGMLFYDKFF